jgi:hypothetical protein
MVQSKERLTSSSLTPIDDIANAWGVSSKAVNNWVEFVYQAFDVLLPANGPYPEWGVKLLEITAKHISVKSSFYFAETGETRRLKSAEFIKKIRSMRQQGHFQEFEKFRNFQKSQDEIDEDEAVASLGALTRGIDEQVQKAKETVDAYADRKMDELAEHIERTPFRMLGSLTDRVNARRILSSSQNSVQDVIDVTYTRVELPEVSELPALPER